MYQFIPKNVNLNSYYAEEVLWLVTLYNQMLKEADGKKEFIIRGLVEPDLDTLYSYVKDKLLIIKEELDGGSAPTHALYDFKIQIKDIYKIRLIISYILSKRSDIEPFGKEKQIRIVKNLIYKKLMDFQNKHLVIKYDDLTHYYENNIEIMGVLAHLDKENYIKMGYVGLVDIIDDDKKHLYFRFNKAEILVKNKFYEEANKTIKTKEKKTKEVDSMIDNSKILYRISYNQREIRVNGKLLSKPNFFGENDIVFDYIHRRPNEICKREDIEKESGEKIKKSFDRIVTDLGFKGELKKAFFPDMSKKAVRLINPVTEKYLKDNNLTLPRNIKLLD